MNLSWVTLANAFAEQTRFCAGYSPLYEAIFSHATAITEKQGRGEPLDFDEQPLIDLLTDGLSARTFQENVIEPTLLVGAAIHAAVLTGCPEAAPISRFFATVGGSYEPDFDRDVLFQMLGGLYLRPGATLRNFLKTGRIQTNEVSRGAGWLLPVITLTTQAGGDLPATLVDLGCSAGLNLAADAQRWRWTATDGDRSLNLSDDTEPLITQSLNFGDSEKAFQRIIPPGPLSRPTILKRIGLDLNPLHLENPAHLLDLRACIWGDQPARLERFDRAVVAYQTLHPAPSITQGNIITAAADLHHQVAPGSRLLLVFNSTVTSYIPDDGYAALRVNIQSTFRALPPSVRGLWLELEPARTGENPTPAKLMALKAHLLNAAGNLTTHQIAHSEAHPQTIHVLERWDEL